MARRIHGCYLSKALATGMLAVASLCVVLPSSVQSKEKSKEIERAKGEFIVKFKKSSAPLSQQAAFFTSFSRKFGDKAIVKVDPFETDPNLVLLRLADDGKLDEAISAAKADGSVEIAEPNYIYRASLANSGLPNDPEFGKTWGLLNSGQADSSGQIGKPGSDINVVPLWEKGFHGSRNVVVAVIDTGVDWDHPDLAPNIYTNPGESGEKANNGIDDDKNGLVDDVHGWNFAAKSNNSKDDHNHGTHVSGTIGAIGDNGVGVAGVNWQVSVLPIKFLDAGGSGTLKDAVEAINYATLMRVNIMSNSWGGGGFSETMFEAIKSARDAGIVFVAAAGNESNNNDASPTYPAGYRVENVIAVAATDNQDTIAYFSNFGTQSVHVAAPGVKVLSTIKNGGYDTYSGTSMATPHVSGIAALLLSANPNWTYAEIKDRLIRTSDPVRGLRRKVTAHGRVNSYNAFYGIIPPSTDPDESQWKNVTIVVESAHPYADRENKVFEITHSGAKMIRVHFEKVDVETKYDHVFIETLAGEAVEDITGQLGDYTSEYVNGDKLIIRLKSDDSVNAYGFKIDRVQVITD